MVCHVKISTTEIFDFPPHDIMIYTSNFHHPSRTTKVRALKLPKLPLRSPCKCCINSLLSILRSFLTFQRSWRFARWLVRKKMNSRNRCLHEVTDEYYIYTTNSQVNTILRTHEIVYPSWKSRHAELLTGLLHSPTHLDCRHIRQYWNIIFGRSPV